MNESKRDWEPRLVGFLCNWCSYAGADLATAGYIRRVIGSRSGRRSLSSCKKTVWVGCHPGDCRASWNCAVVTGNQRH